MDKFTKNQHWIFLIIIGFWMQMSQTIFIIENIHSIDMQFLSPIILIITSICMVSIGMYSIFEGEKAKTIIILSLMLFLAPIIATMISLIFTLDVGGNFLFIQMAMFIGFWYLTEKKKVE